MRFLLAIFFLCFSCVSINAHPHVWLQAKATLVFNVNNHFVGVKHVWQFDEGFTAFATQGLDENGDGAFSREELSELAQVNIESLKDFEYFTFVQMGEKDPEYGVPNDQYLVHENGLLTLHFTLPMKEPVKPDDKKGYQDLTVEVFDATFFVDVAFVDKEPIKTQISDGSQSSCSANLQRRKDLNPIQNQLLSQIGPDEDIPEDLQPEVGDLSNTIRVSCPLS